MLVLKIVLGLVGLGVVVLVHEGGHFLAARLTGIEVEAFSIGWGSPILRKKIGSVEYRLGMFPIGGYCKMKGETEYQEAIAKKKDEIPKVKGSYYGVSPWRRIIVSLAGPFANLVFAAVVMIAVWGSGFDVVTQSNRIILVSDLDGVRGNPSDEGGLKTGDRIVMINGKETPYGQDILEAVAPNADKPLALTLERDGGLIETTVTPYLDKSSGAGKIGVYFWTDPVIAAVSPESSAAVAGLLPGDRILRINGRDTPYTALIPFILDQKPKVLEIDYLRGGEEKSTEALLVYGDDDSVNLGLSFEFIRYRSQALNPGQAIVRGLGETWKSLSLSLKSLALLFRGIDLTRAVSGPVRITYMVGEVAADGFREGLRSGLITMGNFLALISIALCIMNLLPIPVLDGGLVVLFIAEWLKGKSLKPRTIYRFQLVGMVLIFGLMIFAVFGDILFLTGRN